MASVGALLLAGLATLLFFPGIALDPWFRKMLHPPIRKPRPLPKEMAQCAEDVAIQGRHGLLRAWLIWPKGESAPAISGDRRADGLVVFIHGWSSDGGRMAPLAAHVLQTGIACLLVDLPGHGRTGRAESYDAKRMVEDLVVVRDWISQRPDLAELRCAILGYSFGGVGAIVAAVRDSRWDALVVMGAPTGPMQAIEIYLEAKKLPVRWLRRPLYRSAQRVIGVDPNTFAGTLNLPQLRVPALFVHGERDEVVPHEHGIRLHETAPRDLAEIAIVEQAGHDDLLVNEEAGRRVAAFVARVLAGVASSARGEQK